jgi:ribonuclease G
MISSNSTGIENLYENNSKNKKKYITILPEEKEKILLIDTSLEGITRLSKVYYNPKENKYKLINFIEELDNDENIQSNIYLAKVNKIDKSNNSIFFNYEGSKICFLNMKELVKQNFSEENIENIKVNDQFIVQMIRERKNHKHPKVTTNIMMYGLYCNIILDTEFDLFYHNNSLQDTPLYNSLIQHKILKNIKIFIKQPPHTINQKLLMDDIKYMIRTFKHIKTIASNKKEIGLLHFEPHIQRMIRSIIDNNVESIIVNNDNLFHRIKSMPFLFNQKQSKNIFLIEENVFEKYNLTDEINKINKLVISKEGIRITFQKTEALITIDVDYSSKNKNIKNLLEINKEAAQLIIEEIVKKNIGGSIIIDFINMYMANENHNQFVQYIKNQFINYNINCAVYSIKQLGFIVFCLPYNKYDIFHRVYEKCSDCNQGIVVKKLYQLNGIIESINNYLFNKKPFHYDEIYIENNKLFIKLSTYNNLVKYKPQIIEKIIDNNYIPLIF